MTKLKLEFTWIKSENPELITFRGATRSESCGLILNFIKSCFLCTGQMLDQVILTAVKIMCWIANQCRIQPRPQLATE